MRKLLVVGGLVVALWGTWYHGRMFWKTRGEDSVLAMEIQVERLEQRLFACKTLEEVQQLMRECPHFTEDFLHTTAEDAQMAEHLYAMVQNPAMVSLYEEVQRVFPTTEAIQQQIGKAWGRLKHHYPEALLPTQVMTVITGMGVDLQINDQVVIVGLDYFLGEGALYRPSHLPDYLMRHYHPDSLVPKLVLRMAAHWVPRSSRDQTLLADMIYYGKLYHLAQNLLPGVLPQVWLGYTASQYEEVQHYKQVVWEHFIEQELLYVTDHTVKHRYLSDRPATAEIGPDCPGRIGHWLGWDMVQHIARAHPNMGLVELMADKDVQKLLQQARYRP